MRQLQAVDTMAGEGWKHVDKHSTVLREDEERNKEIAKSHLLGA